LIQKNLTIGVAVLFLSMIITPYVIGNNSTFGNFIYIDDNTVERRELTTHSRITPSISTINSSRKISVALTTSWSYRCGITAMGNSGQITHGINGEDYPIISQVSFILNNFALNESLEVNKRVWNGIAWVEEIMAKVGDTVRFNITISYLGNSTLSNIWLLDTLPKCLEYAGNAVPEEGGVSGNTVLWILFTTLMPSENMSLEFDALVVSDGVGVNMVDVKADEWGGNKLSGSDIAIVNISNLSNLVADAGGPYTGLVGEIIKFTGSATGGIIPYTYTWDLDNDGEYDDAVGPTAFESWGAAGIYIIGLKVVDGNANNNTDTAQVTVERTNDPPNKPNTPNGRSSGKVRTSYQYSTNTTDSDGDDVFYLFDWDDGTTSGWLGPYISGDTVNAFHEWIQLGSYSVKVKSMDSNLAESKWSDPLEVSMPKNKLYIITPFLRYLENHPHMFPLLRKLLRP